MRTAAVVVTGGRSADGSVCRPLLAQDEPPAEVIVVDNASSVAERARSRLIGTRLTVRLLLLDDNRQLAGGLQRRARAALAAGADRVLLLNNDIARARRAPAVGRDVDGVRRRHRGSASSTSQIAPHDLRRRRHLGLLCGRALPGTDETRRGCTR